MSKVIEELLKTDNYKRYLCPKCGHMIKVLNINRNKNLMIICEKCNVYMDGHVFI